MAGFGESHVMDPDAIPAAWPCGQSPTAHVSRGPCSEQRSDVEHDSYTACNACEEGASLLCRGEGHAVTTLARWQCALSAS